MTRPANPGSLWCWCTGLVLALASLATQSAEPFPAGVEPTLCAVTDMTSCTAPGDCKRGASSSVDLPRYFKLSIEEKLVEVRLQSGKRRLSEISEVGRQGNTLILTGIEADRGWSAVLEPEDARLTVTVSEKGLGYVLFGACTPL